MPQAPQSFLTYHSARGAHLHLYSKVERDDIGLLSRQQPRYEDMGSCKDRVLKCLSELQMQIWLGGSSLNRRRVGSSLYVHDKSGGALLQPACLAADSTRPPFCNYRYVTRQQQCWTLRICHWRAHDQHGK